MVLASCLRSRKLRRAAHRILLPAIMALGLAHGARAQETVPPDLLQAREALRPLTGSEHLERCTRLVEQATRQLAATSVWRLRVALDCADSHTTAGRPSEAVRRLDALLQEIRGMPVHPAMEIIAMKYRATALGSLGQRGEGLVELERALQLAQRHFGPASDHAQDVGVRLCGAYHSNGRYSDAVTLCSRLHAQRAPAPAGDFTRGYAARLWGFALVERAGPGDVRRGIELLRSAVTEFDKRAGAADFHTLQARRDLAYALGRDQQNEAAEAEARAVRAEFVRSHGERHPETQAVDKLLNVLLIQQARYEEAARLPAEAQEQGSDADPVGRLTQQANTAQRLLRQARNDEALHAYQVWAQDVESLRDTVALEPVAKAQFAQRWHDGYQFLAIAHFRKQQLRAALTSLELAKARSLLHAMEDLEAVRSLPLAERHDILQLSRQASAQRQQQRLLPTASPQGLQAARRAEALEAQVAQRLAHAGAERSRARAKRDEVDFDISGYIRDAPDDEAYLSLGYGLGGQQALMPLLLRRGRVHAPPRPLVIEHHFDGAVAALRLLAQHGTEGLSRRQLKVVPATPEGFQVVSASDPRQAIASPRQVVEYLSEKILGPFRTQLQGVRRLIVSADGAAWLLPFDLLELEGQPLVRRMQVVMTPSVSVLKVLRERQASGAAPMASGRLLAVGGARYRRAVPVVPGAPVFLSRVRDPATPSTFELAMLADASGQAEFMASLSTMLLGANDLPGSLREVSDIARRFDPARVTLLTEQAASEKRIDALARSDALAGYDFLHFATHGFAQSRRPLMSALVMGIDGRDEEHDGYLTAQEIASWNLRARLVVLSACDSAIGATLGGEGALGLPYAFLQAGAAATIQSLWAVPDAATADWMPGLYDRMAAGETPAEALAQVKRRAAAEWTADYVRPAPWAAFVMYGG